MTAMRRTRPLSHRQSGFTLVELMIAIVIGIFLVSGVITVYLSTRQTSLMQASLAQLQDDERTAMTLITDIAQSAGYFYNLTPGSLTTADAALPALSAVGSVPAFVAGQGVAGVSGASASGPGDTLWIRFNAQSGDGTLNCLGSPNPTGGVLQMFQVSADQHLTCSVNGGASKNMVSGVQNLTVLYGVDTDNDGSVDRYLDAGAVSAGSYWLAVVSIQIKLTFINPMANQAGQNPTVKPLIRVINVMSKS